MLHNVHEIEYLCRNTLEWAAVLARQVRQALKAFGKRYLAQLLVLQPRGLLLSLGEEGVNAHRLPQFKLTAQASRTRSECCSLHVLSFPQVIIQEGCATEFGNFH